MPNSIPTSVRLQRAKLRESYLRSLEAIMGPVSEPELLDYETTVRLLSQFRSVDRGAMREFEMPFADKKTPRFANFIAKLQELNPREVYVCLEAANVCGLPRAVPLTQLDFGFPFDIDSNGVVTLFSTDCSDAMVLDFSESSGVQVLELRVAGKAWASASY